MNINLFGDAMVNIVQGIMVVNTETIPGKVITDEFIYFY